MKIFVWASPSMDASVTTILIGNIFKFIDYRVEKIEDFETSYDKWIDLNHDQYDRIFIIGFPMNQKFVTNFEDHNVCYINIHIDNIVLGDSKCITGDLDSISRLIFKKFKDRFHFHPFLKELVLYCDDYTSNSMKYDESLYISALFNTTPNKLTFIRRFWFGFDGFTSEEVEKCDNFFSTIKDECDKLEVFEGDYKLSDVSMVITTLPPNEVGNNISLKKRSDVVFTLNPLTKIVSIRIPPKSTFDISPITEDLFDTPTKSRLFNSVINKKFVEYTKSLKINE